MTSTILARHGDADRSVCVNDLYDAACSTKVDKRDLHEIGRALPLCQSAQDAAVQRQKQGAAAKTYMQLPDRLHRLLMQRLTTPLAPTAPNCPPSNRC